MDYYDVSKKRDQIIKSGVWYFNFKLLFKGVEVEFQPEEIKLDLHEEILYIIYKDENNGHDVSVSIPIKEIETFEVIENNWNNQEYIHVEIRIKENA